jgi:uncharacterized protein YfiM (DUF2279 family)
MANIFVAATATWNGKALTKGQKQLTSFEKSVKSLGRTLGISLGAAALVNYGKKAVTAFVADEKAAKSLEIQLKNTGYAFSSPDVEYYIANLQKMYGVLDDQLRPAFQTLLTASGSLIKSQKGLALALDVSAATGKSVEEVSMALAKGFSGQTTALSRLGAGLDKTILATGDMNLIMDELQRKFSGQALARLDTYAGKMDLLKVSAANASETIGKGILNALSAIGKNGSIQDATKKMEAFATVIANVITGLGAVIGKLTQLASNTGFNKLISFLYSTSGIALLAKLGASTTAAANAPTSNFTYSLGSGAATEIARAQELKIRKQLNAQLAKEVELKKLRDKYDLERISLMAALNQATDEETRLRLAEKLALLDGDASLVDDYMALSNSMKELQDSTYVATEAFNSLAKATQQLLLSFGVSPSQVAAGGSIISTSPGSVGPTLSNVTGLATTSINQGMLGTSKEAIDLSISLGFTDTSNITDALTRAIAQSMTLNTKNGLITVPAGFL